MKFKCETRHLVFSPPPQDQTGLVRARAITFSTMTLSRRHGILGDLYRLGDMGADQSAPQVPSIKPAVRNACTS
jgi:hypothetical protein